MYSNIVLSPLYNITRVEWGDLETSDEQMCYPFSHTQSLSHQYDKLLRTNVQSSIIFILLISTNNTHVHSPPTTAYQQWWITAIRKASAPPATGRTTSVFCRQATAESPILCQTFMMESFLPAKCYTPHYDERRDDAFCCSSARS